MHQLNKEDKLAVGVWFCLLLDENQKVTKYVEGLLIPCLDEGSIPSNSTKQNENESEERLFSFFCFILILLLALIAYRDEELRFTKRTKSELIKFDFCPTYSTDSKWEREWERIAFVPFLF